MAAAFFFSLDIFLVLSCEVSLMTLWSLRDTALSMDGQPCTPCARFTLHAPCKVGTALPWQIQTAFVGASRDAITQPTARKPVAAPGRFRSGGRWNGRGGGN